MVHEDELRMVTPAISTFLQLMRSTMNRRYGACKDRGVPNSSYRGNVVDHRVLAGKAVIQQPFESSVPVFTIEAVEVIPSHLVDNDANHQFGSFELCWCG